MRTSLSIAIAIVATVSCGQGASNSEIRNGAVLVSIAINPQGANISVGTVWKYTAMGTYSDGSTQDLTSAVRWSSTFANVATISNTPGSNGVATTTGGGITSIGASFQSISASAPLIVTAGASDPINIVFGLAYDSIKPTIRTFGLWYKSSQPGNDPTMPIVVYIHGGEWEGGSGFGKIGDNGVITPGQCPDGSTVVCYLANIGYAVYSINYTLTVQGNTKTQWPAQWQDCDCFLKFLAEKAGVSLPGNPQKIVILGDSSGGQLAGMVTLAPHNTFPTLCGHSSLNYRILGIDLVSPPINLRTLFEVNSTPNWQQVDAAIANLLGCQPGPDASPACVAIAASADPANFVSHGQPLVLVQSGSSDNEIPYQLQGALQAAYAGLSPPVPSQWIVYGPGWGHDLDLFYYVPCSSDPDSPEPSPCGTAGAAFGDTLKFLSVLPN